jgi:hypothetical protein
MKGKGKQRSSEDLDANEDDDHSSSSLRAGRSLAKPRRRSSSTTSSLNGQNKNPRSHHFAAERGQLDDTLDDDVDRAPLNRTHRKQRRRNRNGSLLGGLLDKDILPAGATALTKEELRQVYWRRMLINALFILAWSVCSSEHTTDAPKVLTIRLRNSGIAAPP